VGFLAIHSGLKTKRAILRKTKNTEGGISIEPCSNRTGIDDECIS
jgi:hypothetical protein